MDSISAACGAKTRASHLDIEENISLTRRVVGFDLQILDIVILESEPLGSIGQPFYLQGDGLMNLELLGFGSLGGPGPLTAFFLLVLSSANGGRFSFWIIERAWISIAGLIGQPFQPVDLPLERLNFLLLLRDDAQQLINQRRPILRSNLKITDLLCWLCP